MVSTPQYDTNLNRAAKRGSNGAGDTRKARGGGGACRMRWRNPVVPKCEGDTKKRKSHPSAKKSIQTERRKRTEGQNQPNNPRSTLAHNEPKAHLPNNRQTNRGHASKGNHYELRREKARVCESVQPKE